MSALWHLTLGNFICPARRKGRRTEDAPPITNNWIKQRPHIPRDALPQIKGHVEGHDARSPLEQRGLWEVEAYITCFK